MQIPALTYTLYRDGGKPSSPLSAPGFCSSGEVGSNSTGCVAYSHSRPLSLGASHYRDICFPSLPYNQGQSLVPSWPMRNRGLPGLGTFMRTCSLWKGKTQGEKAFSPAAFPCLGYCKDVTLRLGQLSCDHTRSHKVTQGQRWDDTDVHEGRGIERKHPVLQRVAEPLHWPQSLSPSHSAVREFIISIT